MENQFINLKFKNVLGLYLPGDLAISLNYPSEYWYNFNSSNHSDEFYTTLVHETHHYNIFTGTSFGNYYTSIKRQWANYGIKGLLRTKEFCQENKIKFTVPILNWLPYQNKSIQNEISSFFEMFTFYSKVMYFDLGYKQTIQLKNEITNAYIPIGNNQRIYYGAHSIIENAARLEDRLRINDLDYKKIPYDPTYDIHWQYLRMQGFDPYLSLIMLEMSLNPSIPMYKNVKPLEYPPIQELIPSIRLSTIINYIYDDLLKEGLLNVQLGLSSNRKNFDKLYNLIEDIIVEKTGWKSSIQALEDLVVQIDSTGFEKQWFSYPISRDQLVYIINLRKKHPSIFAIQSLGNIQNDQFNDYPPYLIVFKDKGVSTIQDPKKGTFENMERMKLAVAEQLICQNNIGGFICPYCKVTMRASNHLDNCQAEIYLNKLDVNLNEIKFINGKDKN